MNERTKSVLKTVLAAIFFIICVCIVVMGDINVCPVGLFVILLGLDGMIFVLFLYSCYFMILYL